jgi:hypothetical protein
MRDAAQAGWTLFTHTLQLEDRVAARLWRGLERSHHADAQALRQALARIATTPPTHRAAVTATFYATFGPHRVVEILEGLVPLGWCGRKDTNSFQEAIFRRTSPSGQWSLSSKEIALRTKLCEAIVRQGGTPYVDQTR